MMKTMGDKPQMGMMKPPGSKVEMAMMKGAKKRAKKSVAKVKKRRANSMPSKGVGSAKAGKILEDGKVRGHKLTSKQMRMFGAAKSRGM